MVSINTASIGTGNNNLNGVPHVANQIWSHAKAPAQIRIAWGNGQLLMYVRMIYFLFVCNDVMKIYINKHYTSCHLQYEMRTMRAWAIWFIWAFWKKCKSFAYGGKFVGKTWNTLPLFRVSSWNNGMNCMSLYSLWNSLCESPFKILILLQL